MYIAKIRKELESHKGEYISIKYNLGRNKYELFEARIEQIFNHVFLVKLKDREEIKSFSYTDVLTKTIKIDYNLQINK